MIHREPGKPIQFDHDEFRRAWAEATSLNGAAAAMGMTSKTASKYARLLGLEPHPPAGPHFEIIPEDEIYRRAAAIRAGWPASRQPLDMAPGGKYDRKKS